MILMEMVRPRSTSDPTFLARLRQIGGKNLTVEENRSDFRDLLRHCRLSVSQAGYNSVVDLFTSGAPALLAPFTGEGGETEQPGRARYLSAIGRAPVISEDALEGATLAARVDGLIDSGPKRFSPVSCDGAMSSVEALKAYLQA